MLAALAIALSALSPAFAADKPEKWESLFNGRDLSGWVVMHGATFTVTNGNLHLAGGNGWLRTEREYTNFVFEAEWRALEPGYDSGFFVRAGVQGDPWSDNVWQVDLKNSALGRLVRGNTTKVPAETPPMPLNKWVKVRIEVRGHRISLDVDGERVWDYDKLDADSGYIGLEAEEKAFDFRNLRVQELPGDEKTGK